ncbi:reverse transcriptase family protein [Polaribacter vadi]|uniref:reverse transcriptase family protein n=1 Tax=Polaribacter vadi TaxID=1774273 RepID=UPI0030ED5251|tara:strand:+ start:21483 stop:22523 length:1041 start_codon:yes stop_codon:yes gene_type:complete
MDFKHYSENFRKSSTNLGYSEDNIRGCLNYAEKLFENELPVIYNLTHFSKLVGFERNYIIQAAVASKYSDAYYRYHKILKKNGDIRKIKEPLPNLKTIQYWILNNILEKIEPSAFAKAYVKKRGLKQNIRFHIKQKIVYSFDIKDFFPSIKYSNIVSIFLNIGYSEELSIYLAKLCCLEEKLPQGAPTSPYLSNLVFKHIDANISKFCKEKKIRYTRYADDLTFSGEFDHKELYNFISAILLENDFEINKSKTKLMSREHRQIVTGIIVNDKPQLDKETRRLIRQEVYYIKKYSLESHMKKSNIKTSYYLNSLIGKIGFGIYLNPKDSKLKEYHQYLTELYKKLNS